METLIDKGFDPMSEKIKLLKGGDRVSLAVEGAAVFVKSYACDAGDRAQLEILERVAKSMLWIAGGHTLYCDCAPLYEILKRDYAPSGARAFDEEFMSRVFDQPFRVILGEVPPEKSACVKVQKGGEGCRIGFDAGGSQRKVAAVINGVTVFSDAVGWSPKTQTDPAYLLAEVERAYDDAARCLPKVDGIGVSAAGIVVDNALMESSLFYLLNKEQKKSLMHVFTDAAKKYNVPVTVANDGDVAALAGAREFKRGALLGISMGTSQAGGYIDKRGDLNGLFNELAFAPLDYASGAAVDDWSGDRGCGVKYLSQDGVIKLAEMGGMTFEKSWSPTQKIDHMLANASKGLFKAIYHDMGVYLAYAIMYYREFYELENVLLLGGVTAGESGEIIVETAKKLLAEKGDKAELLFMNKKNRKVEQASVAAFL